MEISASGFILCDFFVQFHVCLSSFFITPTFANLGFYCTNHIVSICDFQVLSHIEELVNLCTRGMSASLEVENLEEPEFVWGKRRGVGGKKRDVQFYESFNYDGVEYTLHDCVYMHNRGEPPHIGKLVKVWENADKTKKIKVQWFFRPSEISYYLKDTKVLENELFFASGEGKGLANLNPLVI